MNEVAESFEWYAEWAEDVSSLYRRISLGVSDDPEILDIAAEASAGQPPPQLLLAAVHHLLLQEANHQLAAFYPTCTDAPRDSDEDALLTAFRAFCLANENRLREIVSERRVQTNAVGRSAVLLPSFEFIARLGENASLALVEVGASAGLNLCWDRYRYEYQSYGSFGVAGSPVHITSVVRGDNHPPLPDTVPSVGYRVGIDLEPLDITDDEDARWLQALVIPDQSRRHNLLKAAISVVQKDPPKLREGAAVDCLPEVLANVPEEYKLCVFSTHTLYQMDDSEVMELKEILEKHSRQRSIHWLSDDPTQDHGTYRYVGIEDGNIDEVQLAEYQSYGRWIRWLL